MAEAPAWELECLTWQSCCRLSLLLSQYSPIAVHRASQHWTWTQFGRTYTFKTDRNDLLTPSRHWTLNMKLQN